MGIEPMRLASADLKPASLTTRTPQRWLGFYPYTLLRWLTLSAFIFVHSCTKTEVLY